MINFVIMILYCTIQCCPYYRGVPDPVPYHAGGRRTAHLPDGGVPWTIQSAGAPAHLQECYAPYGRFVGTTEEEIIIIIIPYGKLTLFGLIPDWDSACSLLLQALRSLIGTKFHKKNTLTVLQYIAIVVSLVPKEYPNSPSVYSNCSFTGT